MSSKSRRRRADVGLSRQRIVELAIEHADADGIEQLSMRKLAGELSVTPMALYWHFDNRDALIDAMAEHVAGTLEYDDDSEAPWQERLTYVLTATLAAFQTHPWLGPIACRRIVPAPAYLRALEVLLDLVRAAGYESEAAPDVVDFAVDSVAAMAERLERASKDEPGRASKEQLEMRQRLIDLTSADYPRIHEAVAEVTMPHDPTAYAALGIRMLVGGIEAAAHTTSGR